MVDVIDLQSDADKHILNDDTTATLKLTNTNTSLAGRGIESSGLSLRTDVAKIPAANATITQFTIAGVSRPSGAILSFTNDGLVSLTSVLATTGGVAGTYGIRIAQADGTFGWIPVYPDGAVTAVAI